MTDNNITFVFFVFNESRRIEQLLRCFKDYGKLLIIDNGSTDNTIALAKKYTTDIYHYENIGWVETKEETDFVFDKITTEWVYLGSADELAPKKLLNKLVSISKENQYKVVYLGRINHHYGLNKLHIQNSELPRFFKIGSVNFENNKIHKFGKIVAKNNEILHLKVSDEYSIHHFSTYNITKFQTKHNSYSDIEAKQRFDDGFNFSLKKLLFIPIYVFIKYYIINGSWKSGLPGFIMTLEYCFFFFNIEAKLWELQNNITIESIEKKYDILKEEMIKNK